MGAVLGGLTLLQLIELANALGTLALNIPKIWQMIDDLRAGGHPESAPIPDHLPEEIRAEIKRAIVDPINSEWPATHDFEGG